MKQVNIEIEGETKESNGGMNMIKVQYVHA